MRKRSQAIIAAMLALGMAVGMCGCEGQLPTPKATTRQDAPNLSAKQEQKVRTRILKTLDQCNQNRDTDTLPTILEGPELDIRTSELNVAKATGNLDRKTTIPTDLAQAVDLHGCRLATVRVLHHVHNQGPAVQASAGVQAGFRTPELQAVGCGATVLRREDAEFRNLQNRQRAGNAYGHRSGHDAESGGGRVCGPAAERGEQQVRQQIRG